MNSGYGEFRGGWPVVLSSFLGIGLGLSPLPYYTLGVFRPYLAAEFGWSTKEVMGAITVTTLMTVWAGPTVGWLSKRLGVRRIVLISIPLFALAFMSVALSNGSIILFYATWALVAIVGAGTLPITWTRAVNDWFDRRKGLALGLSLMGTGLFGFLVKPLLAWLIPQTGWRGAYVCIGLLPLLIAWPAALLLFREPGIDAATREVAAGSPGGQTLAQALRDWRFWLIAGALVPVSLTLGGPVPNMETILKGAGISSTAVPLLASLVGLSALTGRVLGGWLADRFWAPAVAFIIIVAPGLSCWLLAQATLAYPMAALAICLIGFALGVEYDLMAYFVARYFGMRDYGTIYGVLYVCFALGAGFGPLLFGWDFDTHGNYQLSLHLSFVVLVVSASSLLLLGRYRVFPDEAAIGPDAGETDMIAPDARHAMRPQ